MGFSSPVRWRFIGLPFGSFAFFVFSLSRSGLRPRNLYLQDESGRVLGVLLMSLGRRTVSCEDNIKVLASVLACIALSWVGFDARYMHLKFSPAPEGRTEFVKVVGIFFLGFT